MESIQIDLRPGCSMIYGTRYPHAPLTTIAIPTYKRPGFLRDALKSALAQRSSAGYEVIIIDNDQSPAILEVVSDFPPSRIAVFQNAANLGLWGNFNRALELSRGEWIIHHLDDDLLKPDAILAFEKLLAANGGEDIGCLVGRAEILLSMMRRPRLDDRQSYISVPFDGLELSERRPMLQVSDDTRLVDVPKLCSSFFRRLHLLELGGWDAACGGFGDLAMFARIQRERRLFACNELFGCYRAHEDTMSHPKRQWEEFPLSAGRRFLANYVSEDGSFGTSIRRTLERSYATGLWKRPMSAARRKEYARELLSSGIVRGSRRRFLLRNVWLLAILAKFYSIVRPLLGQVTQPVFQRVRKLAELRTHGRKPEASAPR